MKIYQKFQDNFFYIFLILFIIIGAVFSLKVGITHDEAHSNWVWELNKKKISNIFLNTNHDISYLNTYHGYYGIGFYFLSFLLDNFFFNIFELNNINQEGKILLLKHPTVFIFFAISGIFLRKILIILTSDKTFSDYSTIFYLTYPYLLGHSFFNIKDIPFMSMWLICTYYLIKNLNNFFLKKIVRKKDLIIFGITTSYLLSLRVSGVLIFVEYLIFLIFYTQSFKIHLRDILKYQYKNILLFLFIFLTFSYLLYPSFWSNPLNFISAIKFMGQHIQTVCTTTLGNCMKAQNLPVSYIFIWLFFKLPTLILLGLFLFPFIEKKIFSNKTDITILGSLITSILVLIFLLIFLNVNLYDELRQILFLIPLIFIVSLKTIYFMSRKISLFFICIFIIFFTAQNIKLFPYNYIWLNNFNFTINVNKNFELDYWGVSTKEVANYIESTDYDNSCLISNRNQGIKFFLKKQDTCLKSFNELHKNNRRPFLIAMTERFLKKGVPNGCVLIHSETKKLNFSSENLIFAKIYRCD